MAIPGTDFLAIRDRALLEFVVLLGATGLRP